MLKSFRDSAVEFRQNLQGLVMSDFMVRIYYEDTDCGGIVYHTNYIKYCERARSEIFFGEGAMPNTDSIGLVVRKMNAEFLDSARLGDLLRVKTRILKLGGSSLTLKQEIFLVDSCESWGDSCESNKKSAPRGSILDEKSGLCSYEQGNKAKSPIDEASGKLPDLSLKDNALLIFECEVKLACIDIKRKKIAKIPPQILAILQTKF